MEAQREKNIRKIVQKEGFFPSDGRWLFYRCWHTHPKNGEVLAIHGACEHSARYQELGNYLAGQGFDFYMFDMTGHGRSEGKRGHIWYFEEYLSDIANFYGFLRVFRKMQKPFLLGHNLGGLLATLFASWGTCPVKGLLLSAPMFQLKTPMSFPQRQMLKILSLFYPGCYLNSRIETEYLSHDRSILDEYTADPMVQQRITSRMWGQIHKAMRWAPCALANLKVPCLIWHGEEDKVADVEGSKKSFQILGSPDKELYLVPQGFHELFNEPDRTKVFAKTVEWLKKKN